MKFYNWLNEGTPLSSEKLADMIEKHCQQFLKEWRHNILWSGRKSKAYGNFTPLSLKQIRTDRIPRDTPKKLHDVLDYYFKKKFGKKLRSETLFCTGSIETAKEFGAPYMVFPIGKYEVYWSDINDLTIWIPKLFANFNEENFQVQNQISAVLKGWGNGLFKKFSDIPNTWNFPDTVEGFEEIEDWANKNVKKIVDIYHKGNLGKVNHTQNEIMLDCKDLYLVYPHDYKDLKSILMDRGY